jgi:hypothetical protein
VRHYLISKVFDRNPESYREWVDKDGKKIRVPSERLGLENFFEEKHQTFRWNVRKYCVDQATHQMSRWDKANFQTEVITLFPPALVYSAVFSLTLMRLMRDRATEKIQIFASFICLLSEKKNRTV